MSVPYRTPRGVKLACALLAIDALLNLDNVLQALSGETPLPYPIAVIVGLAILVQIAAQLFTVHGLYLLKPKAWERAVSALQSGLFVDFLGLFTGKSSLLDLALTVAGLVYLYATKREFVPPGR